MKEPRYQERKASAIPVAENEDRTVKARVVAGEALGKKGASRRTRLSSTFTSLWLQEQA